MNNVRLCNRPSSRSSEGQKNPVVTTGGDSGVHAILKIVKTFALTMAADHKSGLRGSIPFAGEDPKAGEAPLTGRKFNGDKAVMFKKAGYFFVNGRTKIVHKFGRESLFKGFGNALASSGFKDKMSRRKIRPAQSKRVNQGQMLFRKVVAHGVFQSVDELLSREDTKTGKEEDCTRKALFRNVAMRRSLAEEISS